MMVYRIILCGLLGGANDWTNDLGLLMRDEAVLRKEPSALFQETMEKTTLKEEKCRTESENKRDEDEDNKRTSDLLPIYFVRLCTAKRIQCKNNSTRHHTRFLVDSPEQSYTEHGHGRSLNKVYTEHGLL